MTKMAEATIINVIARTVGRCYLLHIEGFNFVEIASQSLAMTYKPGTPPKLSENQIAPIRTATNTRYLYQSRKSFARLTVASNQHLAIQKFI